MFEEIDLKIADEATAEPQFNLSWTRPCTVTGSGGYGTSCKYCC